MLSGQVADGLMTILAGEMVPHESECTLNAGYKPTLTNL
jgi:hypothetical protein